MNSFIPLPSADTEIFYNGWKDKKLLFHKCRKCGNIIWPFSIACPECLDTETELIESKGRGQIYTYTIFNVPFHKDFKDKIPYVVAIVKLSEGPKLVTNIVNTSFRLIQCDSPVKIVWQKSGDCFIPVFYVTQ